MHLALSCRRVVLATISAIELVDEDDLDVIQPGRVASAATTPTRLMCQARAKLLSDRFMGFIKSFEVEVVIRCQRCARLMTA
jgi:hypothetical protein